MNLKSKFSISVILIVLSISSVYIFNFVTNKQDAFPVAKTSKYTVEVFKTPTCDAVMDTFHFLKENSLR